MGPGILFEAAYGRWIQSLFGKPMVTNLFIKSMKPFPGLVNRLVKQTHGDNF